jgi:membrane-bound lytic murein transglycosylase A
LKAFLLVLFLKISCLAFAQYTTPTIEYNQKIEFSDDIEFENLQLSIDRQLKTYKLLPAKTSITYGRDGYSIAELIRGLELFLQLTRQYSECRKTMVPPDLFTTNQQICLDKFNSTINQHYVLYRPLLVNGDDGYASSEPALFTSYYSPDLDGSLEQTEEYKYPVYSNPGSKLEKLFTRNEILLDLAFKDIFAPIFWVKNSMFDQYLFHIEGGGRVKFTDAEGVEQKRYLSYDGSNGKKLTFVYKYLLERGYLEPGKASINQQRDYLEQNPDKIREVFNQSPSFIYFKVTDDEPLGIQNIPLTEKRSIALDRNYYKLSGALTFIQGQLPSYTSDGTIVRKKFARFYLHQDTGGAIKGKARADLYSGFGPQAELEANYTKSNGNITFLLPKKTSQVDDDNF